MHRNYYDFPCQSCGYLNDINFDRCQNQQCSELISVPFIIRRASIEAEKLELQCKYEEAINQIFEKGKRKSLDDFEELVKQNGDVVINAPVAFVFSWFLKNKAAYLPYKKLVDLKIREHAPYSNATKRSYVDSAIFGDRNMIFGALTVNEVGLRSYGPVMMILNKKFIQRTAALLIENSFHFHDRAVLENKWTIDKPLPPGNICDWDHKHELAILKCKDLIIADDDLRNYPEYILKSTGNRNTDEFIEAYIDAEFYPTMVEKLKFPANLIDDFNTRSDLLEYKLQFEEIGRKVKVEAYE